MAIKTRLEDMVIGDKIICYWRSNSSSLNPNNHFSLLGSVSSEPSVPISFADSTGTRYYFIYVGNDFKGRMILIADRNVCHTISWDQLNTMGYATKDGVPITTLGLDPTKWKTNIRLLTGGVSSALKANSEWDKYIVKSTLGGTITAGDDAVWNWSGIASVTSTTYIGAAANRTTRGNTSVTYLNSVQTSGTPSTVGFRPVLVAESLAKPIVDKYLIQDGEEIKTFLNNSWFVIGQSPSTHAMFDQGMNDLKVIPAEAWALLEGDFDVLTYTNKLDNIQSIKVNATPHGQLILAETDFSLVEDLTITASAAGVKLIASGDSGVSWNTYLDSRWMPIEPAAEVVKSSGMDPATLNALTDEQWEELGRDIRLGFYVEDAGLVDKVTVNKKAVSTMTPTLERIHISYSAVTIEGRLKDLELMNVINMAKLEFKTNALMNSTKYALHDMVIDTCQTEEMHTIPSDSGSLYDSVSKCYRGMGAVETNTEELPDHRKSLMVNANHIDCTFKYSLDNGGTWSDLVIEEVIDIASETGTQLKIQVHMPTVTAELKALSYAWA